MINKRADEASAILLLIYSHEVWVKVTYDWSGLVLMLMSTQFSLAYTCTCAHTYALVKTRLKRRRQREQ